MCDFHEPYFGASYPDACCIDGELWDEDSYDSSTDSLTSGGEIPCPQCNHEAFLEYFADEYRDDGAIAHEDGKPREYVHRKVICEQPGDEEKLRKWWLEGWDQMEKEAAK